MRDAQVPVSDDVIDALADSIRHLSTTRHLSPTHLPNKNMVIRLLVEMQSVIFPGFFGSRDLDADSLPAHVASMTRRIATDLTVQVEASLEYAEALGGPRPKDDAGRASDLTIAFLRRLPEVRRLLSHDVAAALRGDPAARHTDEIVFCYPGVQALMVHRVAHELFRLGVPMLPRIMSEHAHSTTGIDIHPGAQIGERFFIDHGTGVVIGETTVIGHDCTLYQGVTLGAKNFPTDAQGELIRGLKRHPTLGHRVIVYASATILGGDTLVGDDCVIGGGVFLTRSVPAGHVVRVGRPEQIEKPATSSGLFEWGGSGI